jgi:hypothetical protein
VNKHIIPISALWHFRFGQLSNNRLSQMTCLYPSITCDNKAICDVCHFSKQNKLPYPSSKSHTQSKFELLHFDIWGPLVVPSIHGHKYFLKIVDGYSRFVWIILLKNKSVVSTHVQSFITMVETMVLNFCLIPFMLLRVSFTIGPVWRIPNKMGELSVSINIF